MTIDKTDLAGGSILAATGLFVSLQALDFGLGTLRNIGPGFFPLIAGVMLTLLGAALVLTGIKADPGDDGDRPAIRWGAAACVFGGLLAWAALTPRFGLVPGTTAMIVITSFAAGRPKPGMILGLVVVLCGAGYLLFAEGLGLPLPAFKF